MNPVEKLAPSLKSASPFPSTSQSAELKEMGSATGLSSTLITAAPASPGARESVLRDVAVNARYFSHFNGLEEDLLAVINRIGLRDENSFPQQIRKGGVPVLPPHTHGPHPRGRNCPLRRSRNSGGQSPSGSSSDQGIGMRWFCREFRASVSPWLRPAGLANGAWACPYGPPNAVLGPCGPPSARRCCTLLTITASPAIGQPLDLGDLQRQQQRLSTLKSGSGQPVLDP